MTSLFFLSASTPAVNLLAYWRAPDRARGPADAIVVLGEGATTKSGQLQPAVPPARHRGHRARTTHEEAQTAQGTLGPRGIRRIIRVTDAASMALSAGVFEKAGFTVIPSSAVPVVRWGAGPGSRLRVALAVVTSVGAYALGVAALDLKPGQLRAAAPFGSRLIGMSTVFRLANLAIGLICVSVVLGATGTFVSAYLLNDVTLCTLSALQGVCFHCWRAGGGRGRR